MPACVAVGAAADVVVEVGADEEVVVATAGAPMQ